MATTKRELAFSVFVYVNSETEYVRLADEWRLRMSHATQAWAAERDINERAEVGE